MADSKITGLPASAGLIAADLVAVVDDVAGTPATEKATFTQVATIVGTELNISGTNTGDEAAASTTVSGISEFATATEINTGTDTFRSVNVAELSDSNFGLGLFEFKIPAPVVGDGAIFLLPLAEAAGENIVDARAQWSGTVGTGAATSIQLHNTTQAVDVFSTNLTIDDGERSSQTAATPVVIDTAQDDITLDDVYQMDIDAIGSTVAGTDLLVQIFTRIP